MHETIVAGRVVDADGHRAPGAVVIAFTEGAQPLEDLRLAEIVRVDGDARFRFGLLPGGALLVVPCWHDNPDPLLRDLSQLSHGVRLSAGRPVRTEHLELRLPFRLGSLCAVRGVVEGPSGEPLPGHRVLRTGPERDSVRHEAWTDADGAFEVGELLPGRVEIRIAGTRRFRGARLAIVLAPGQVAEPRLRLEPRAAGPTVTLRFRCESAGGRPAAGTSLEIMLGAGREGLIEPATADAAGDARLDGVPADLARRGTVRAEHREHASALALFVGPPHDVVRLRLEPPAPPPWESGAAGPPPPGAERGEAPAAAFAEPLIDPGLAMDWGEPPEDAPAATLDLFSLVVRVVDAAGVPVVGAPVTWSPDRIPPWWPIPSGLAASAGETDAGGRVMARRVPALDGVIRARDPESAHVASATFALECPPAGSAVEVELRLNVVRADLARLVVRVEDEGRDWDGVGLIQVSPAGAAGDPGARAADDFPSQSVGVAIVLPPGRWRVSVPWPGDPEWARAVVELAPRERRVVVLRIPPRPTGA